MHTLKAKDGPSKTIVFGKASKKNLQIIWEKRAVKYCQFQFGNIRNLGGVDDS